MRIVWLILLFPVILNAEEYSVEDIHGSYSEIFSLNIVDDNGNIYPDVQADSLDETHYLSGLINDNLYYFSFLINNLCQPQTDSVGSYYKDTTQLSRYFINTLCQDTIFDKAMLTMVDGYLRSQGDEIVDFESAKLYKVEMSDILARAARFFYPFINADKGEIGCYICVGNHGLWEFGTGRDFLVEAFCYAVVRNAKGSIGEWFEIFFDIKKDAKKACFSDDDNIFLYRLQGAVWANMAQHKKLKKAIKDEYRRNKKILPFSISD